MSSKLTKDQKREKKKRDERKRQLRLEHEENLHAKKIDGLMKALLLALHGLGMQDEIDSAVLRLGGAKSVAASERETSFQGPAWAALRQRTTKMVALLQSDPSAHYSGFGLEGRLYLNGDGSTDFNTLHFPLNAAIGSNWQPDEVFAKNAKELDPEPSQGVYFFGMEVRDRAVHFAIASRLDSRDPPEAYFVAPKGWHRLDLDIWKHELFPALVRVSIADEMMGGPRQTFFAMDALADLSRAHKGVSKDNGDAPALLFDDKARTVICCLGTTLLMESEFMAAAAESAKAIEHEEALAKEWNEGFAARQLELDEVRRRCCALEQENRQLRPARVQGPSAPEDNPQRPVVPLQQRMGALLGV